MRAVLKACVNVFIYSRTPHLLLEDVSNGSAAPVPAAAVLLAAGEVLKPALGVIGRLSEPIRKEQLLHAFNPAAPSAAAGFFCPGLELKGGAVYGPGPLRTITVCT